MNILDKKRTCRKAMLTQRAKLNKLKKVRYDNTICQLLTNIIEENNFQCIHSYLPMGTEIDITPVIQFMLENGNTVITPKTLPKRKLQNLILHSLDDLEEGVFGTSHPANSKEFTGKYDMVIVPGLAFDLSYFRLGYGGGYYDNFLVDHPEVLKVGIAYPFQLIEEIPKEKHDIQLDRLLCDSSFYNG